MTDNDEFEFDRRELRTKATPQQLWEAWAQPEIIAGWFADRAYGSPEKGSTITHVFESFGMEVPFSVVEAIPGETIVFDGVGPGGRPFRQEVRIQRDGGETVLQLTHSGFDADADWGDEFEGIDSGWTLALAVLRHYLENHFGRSKTTWMKMRPMPFDFARADELFRSGRGLGQWLTTGEASIGEPGDPVALSLRDGRRVSGTVLAWSGREVALSWDELEGVVELKAFAAGPGPTMAALRAMSWAEDPPATEVMHDWMDAALDGLGTALSRV